MCIAFLYTRGAVSVRDLGFACLGIAPLYSAEKTLVFQHHSSTPEGATIAETGLAHRANPVRNSQITLSTPKCKRFGVQKQNPLKHPIVKNLDLTALIANRNYLPPSLVPVSPASPLSIDSRSFLAISKFGTRTSALCKWIFASFFFPPASNIFANSV